MSLNDDIRKLVDNTMFVDTHEHLFEESVRVRGARGEGEPRVAAPDFGMLLSHYTDSDLIVSGMPSDDLHEVVYSWTKSPKDKWKLLAPYWARVKHTGYGRYVRESVRALYGADDLREDTVDAISEKLRAAIQPGFYHHILRDVAHIEYAQVNSLRHTIFNETEMPDLLMQDISTVSMSSDLNIEAIQHATNKTFGSLKEYHAVIDGVFEKYGPLAIATKNQSAYSRKLDYAQVSEAEAAPLFDRFLKNPDDLQPAEEKALQDHLFHYVVDKATAHKLPVKLHTGYYAGQGGMPLHRVRDNAGDVCALLKAHPDARFDFFHIDYPYQDEMIAIAKHYPNAWVDMCWVWIINPAASVRFLKEFIMAAPANKVFTFGGDVMPIELVPGHANVARQGIAQVVSELVEEGWLVENDAPELIERLMRGNAHEYFDYEGRMKNWTKRA
jgi:predicted TIM-barrel fold metal-dependent hydrolase